MTIETDEPGRNPIQSRTEFLWHVHDYLNAHIRFADTKAQIVVVWVTGLVGALFASGFYGQHKFASFPLCIRLTLLLGLVMSFVAAITSISPRLKTTHAKGFIYWLSIIGYGGKPEFVVAANELSDEEMARVVAEHLYDLSEIARDKYWWVNLSIILAVIGSCGSGVLYLLAQIQASSS